MHQAKHAQRVRSYRPLVEMLEDRTLLNFRTATSYPAGPLPYAVATGDFGNDNRPDIVVSNLTSNYVSVLLNNGDGTFGNPISVPAGPNDYVDVADLRRIGRRDIVAAGGEVDVILGNGNDTFQPYVAYSINGHYAFGVAVGDFNGDGIPDIVTANIDNGTVSVLLGNGDGTFQAARDFNTDYLNYAVEVGDFNNDGKLDIVTVNHDDNAVTLLLGNGDGTFQSPRHFSVGDISLVTGPRSVAVADFNHDSNLDLAVADDDQSGGTYNVSVLLGNGDGTFRSPALYHLPNTSFAATPYSIDTGDFNRDGNSDLITANYNSSNASVLLGNPDGTFRTDQNYTTDAYSRGVAVDDFDGDGWPDAVTVNINAGNVSVLINNTFWSGPSGGNEFAPFLPSSVVPSAPNGYGSVSPGVVVGSPTSSASPSLTPVVSSQTTLVDTGLPLDVATLDRLFAHGTQNRADPIPLLPRRDAVHNALLESARIDRLLSDGIVPALLSASETS